MGDTVSFFGLIRGFRSSDSTAQPLRLDKATNSIQTIDYAHHEIHGGSSFFVCYSTADLGGMTTPADMIQLSFATPDTTKWLHMMFVAKSGGAALFTVTEAPTGGLATPTGTLAVLNCNRNLTATASTILSAAGGTPALVSYDGTVATGGTVLWSEYVGQGNATAGYTGGRFEIILKRNTVYAVSLLDTTAITATLFLDWYEHTDIA
jgi:hypothetical protein